MCGNIMLVIIVFKHQTPSTKHIIYNVHIYCNIAATFFPMHGTVGSCKGFEVMS